MKKLAFLFFVLQILIGCSKSNDSSNEPNVDMPPGNFSVTMDEVYDKSTIIVWTASKDPENVNVKYDVYLNEELVASQLQTLTYTFTELSPEISYNGKVVASDGSNSTTINFSFTTQALIPVAFIGNMLLSTQQEVIDFGKNQYSSIEGSLKIGSFDSSQPISDIDDLTLLNDLTAVSGSIEIYRTRLENFEGLNNLISIGAYFYIWDNSLLLNLNALESLTTVVDELSVSRNPMLSNLNGFNSITQVEHLIIYECDALQNLSGLQNINPVLNNLTITGNDLLTDISALGHISSVEYLFIEENASLQNIDGLDNITKVGVSLRISDNSSLTDLGALGNLSTVGELATFTFTGDYGISIKKNPLLENLDGLQSLIKISGDLYIGENNNLLNFNGLNNLAEITGNLWFEQNDSLEHIGDLENLISIHRDLRIYFNSSITNLDGLSKLERLADVQIVHNTSLGSVCGLQNVLINYENSSILNIYIAENAFDLNGGVTRQDIIDGNCSL